ncbi:ABC transporter permease [Rhodovibrionaceae bacterium A322]
MAVRPPTFTNGNSSEGPGIWEASKPLTQNHLGSRVYLKDLGNWLAGSAVLIALLFAIPVVTIAAYVLVPASPLWGHLVDTVLWDYLSNTLLLVLMVGCGVLLLGVPTAWLVTLYRFPGHRLFEVLLILPLAVPAYVMAYAYTDFLQFTGPPQTLLRELTGWGAREYWFPNVHSVEGAATMLTLVLYPYVYLLSRSAFLEQSVCALEVSRTLGCTPFQSFYRVALPLARPAIIGGMILALMETMADFGTVSYFGVQTFTTGIYRAWFSMGDPTAAAQLSSALLGLVALIILLERLNRGSRKYHHATNRYQQLPGYHLKGAAAAGAILLCALPVLLGFILPCWLLFTLAYDGGDAQLGHRYLELIGNSFSLSAITSACAVVLAVLVAYAVRLKPNLMVRSATRVASLGYAVPGSIIAIGVLVPFAWFDSQINHWASQTLGVSTGLLLTGSLAALIFAYLVRFLAVALQSVESGLGKIRPSMDEAARSLGHGPFATLRDIHGPLMKGSLLTAALMVFVDVMKELPATLLMRPFNFDTLAVQAHNLASDERLSEAATPALTIVAVGLVPVILLSRAIRRSRAGSQEG